MSGIHPPPDGDGESANIEATARLLGAAGPRVDPSDERFARVERSVRGHWEADVRRRLVRRRVAFGTGVLAAAVIVMVVRVSDDRTSAPAGTIVAQVARISGQPSEVDRAGVVGRLAVDDAVLAGESIATGDSGRLALRFADGTSLRLDVASRVTMIAPRVVELSSGAVYVDTANTVARFEVRTAIGTARDVGTQFEVRLVADRLRVRVRSGVVELSDHTRTVTGHAETEILLSANGAESHSFSPYGPEWDWTAAAAPVIDMDGVTLSTYLERLAREQGWSVQYSDQALARDAGGIVLHGSVAGLATTEALDVAVGTSGLMYRVDNGRLMVFRETPR